MRGGIRMQWLLRRRPIYSIYIFFHQKKQHTTTAFTTAVDCLVISRLTSFFHRYTFCCWEFYHQMEHLKFNSCQTFIVESFNKINYFYRRLIQMYVMSINLQSVTVHIWLILFMNKKSKQICSLQFQFNANRAPRWFFKKRILNCTQSMCLVSGICLPNIWHVSISKNMLICFLFKFNHAVFFFHLALGQTRF